MTERYDRVAQTLHWLIAVMIIGLWAMGENFENVAKGQPRLDFIALHRSVGMVLLLLVLLRIVWRLTHRPPPALPASRLADIATKAMHHGFYLLMVLIPVLGVLATWTHGRDLSIFGAINLPTMFASNKAIYEPLEEVHGFLASLIVLLAAAHALMALIHHFWMKDATLKRMSPFGS